MSEQRIALVTGASRGIGHAIALAFARAGYCVIGTATGTPGTAAITSALAPLGDNHRAFILNLVDRESIASFFEQLAIGNRSQASLNSLRRRSSPPRFWLIMRASLAIICCCG